MKSNIKNIFVFKNRGLGDAILGLSSVAWLKSIYPEAKVVYGVPHWVHPLFDKVKTHCDETIPLRLEGVSDFFGFYKFFNERNFDLILELHQTGRSKIFFNTFGRFIQAKYFYHNHHLKKENFILDQGVTKPNIQRDLDGVYSAIKYIDTDRELHVPHYLQWPPQICIENRNPSGDIVLGVVATRQAKMWPLEYYAILLGMIKSKGFSKKILIPVSSEPKDRVIREALIKIGLPSNAEFIQCSLSELPENIKNASIYIGNDTGLKHVCASIGMDTYTFFGPEEPMEWHPYDPQKHRYFFLEKMPCRAQQGGFCGESHCSNHFCLKEIKPDYVLSELHPSIWE